MRFELGRVEPLGPKRKCTYTFSTASQWFAVLSDNLIKQKVNTETKMSFQIILGSASMARRKILAEMGYEFTIMTADIDEKSIRMDKPEELVMVLAEAKADAIISRLQSTSQPDEDAHATLLITADTVVVYEGIIREKPSSKEEAWNFIKVIGSVFVTNLKTGKRQGGCCRAEVYFHVIPEEIIDSLIEEGITLDVAGGLMLEHPLISPFVEAVVGTTDTVMGLPKELTEKLIHEALQLL
ncbi:maf-like protein isoform X1 [Prunus yedoensis var. nudiflora]|uniref:Maf-like protein isoform X1 n=1 Tax=Prunus yedoensis var. nudiflora TaxID=2094558 RepID=A0A314YMW2_PRUYE|nr:maf-like protein isoform X1 [Prunus yedoensis var. nudiflora]